MYGGNEKQMSYANVATGRWVQWMQVGLPSVWAGQDFCCVYSAEIDVLRPGFFIL